MIAVVDYGAGNLFSVNNALRFLGLECIFTSEITEIEKCSSIILPGVGAFADAMGMLDRAGLVEFLKAQAKVKPFLGICVGAQLLFCKGYENGETEGLSLIGGSVRKINATGMKIPHIGWNNIVKAQPSPLLEGVLDDSFAYFVHSYKIDTDDSCVAAYCEYGEKIPAVVQNAQGGNIFGIQFHPEKSGKAGLRMLQNFGRLK